MFFNMGSWHPTDMRSYTTDTAPYIHVSTPVSMPHINAHFSFLYGPIPYTVDICTVPGPRLAHSCTFLNCAAHSLKKKTYSYIFFIYLLYCALFCYNVSIFYLCSLTYSTCSLLSFFLFYICFFTMFIFIAMHQTPKDKFVVRVKLTWQWSQF